MPAGNRPASPRTCTPGEPTGPGRWLSKVLATQRGAVAGVLVASLLWGSAFPAIKRSYVLLAIGPEDFGGVLLFAGVRFLVAGLLLLAGAVALGLWCRLTARQLACLALLGLVQTTLQYATFYIGMAHTSAVKASVIVASGSFFLAFLSPLFFTADRLSWRGAIGLAIGFAGVVLANGARSAGAPGIEPLGDALVLVTGLASALASLLSKRLLTELHPVLVNGYQATLGALVLVVASLPFGTIDPARVDSELVALTLYLAAVTASAFSLYYVVVKLHDLSRVAAYRFLIPLAAVTLSATLVPGERLDWHLAGATVLVAGGIWLVSRTSRRGPR